MEGDFHLEILEKLKGNENGLSLKCECLRQQQLETLISVILANQDIFRNIERAFSKRIGANVKK